MKTLAFAFGVLTGLAFSRIPHYVNQYADSPLPKEYEGPKSRYWNGGVPTDGPWPPAPWLAGKPDEAGFERVIGL